MPKWSRYIAQYVGNDQLIYEDKCLGGLLLLVTNNRCKRKYSLFKGCLPDVIVFRSL